MIPVGRKVAVVLAGCGRSDGSDVIESTAMLIHLSKHKAQTTLFAPNIPQFSTESHFLVRSDPFDPRNVLVEASRMSRSAVQPLDTLDAAAFDVLMFPGGHGVTTNFGGYNDATNIQPDVHKALVDFHAARKPIGVVGAASNLFAKVFKGAIVAGESPKSRGEVVVDPAHRVVSAYVSGYNTPKEAAFDAMGELVDKTISL